MPKGPADNAEILNKESQEKRTYYPLFHGFLFFNQKKKQPPNGTCGFHPPSVNPAVRHKLVGSVAKILLAPLRWSIRPFLSQHPDQPEPELEHQQGVQSGDNIVEHNAQAAVQMTINPADREGFQYIKKTK